MVNGIYDHEAAAQPSRRYVLYANWDRSYTHRFKDSTTAVPSFNNINFLVKGTPVIVFERNTTNLIEEIVLGQTKHILISMNKGLNNSGISGMETVHKEMNQLHDHKFPINFY